MNPIRILTSTIAFIVVTSMYLGRVHIAKVQSDQISVHQIAQPMSDISKRLEGTWKLVKTEGRPSVPKSEHNPSGYIIYDSTGHVHVQIMFRNDRKRFFPKIH